MQIPEDGLVLYPSNPHYQIKEREQRQEELTSSSSSSSSSSADNMIDKMAGKGTQEAIASIITDVQEGFDELKKVRTDLEGAVKKEKGKRKKKNRSDECCPEFKRITKKELVDHFKDQYTGLTRLTKIELWKLKKRYDKRQEHKKLKKAQRKAAVVTARATS